MTEEAAEAEAAEEAAEPEEAAEAEAAEEAAEPEEEADAEEVETADDELVEIEDLETPLGAAPMTVRVEMSVDGTASYGAEITLTAEILGCEPGEVIIRWQYSPDGGETVVTVPEADGMVYSFILSEENMGYLWRAVVIPIAPTEQ